MPIAPPLPGCRSIRELLHCTAPALAAQPWLERQFAVLRDVLPVPSKSNADDWWLVDGEGTAIRLGGVKRMTLLARSGGHPIDVAGIWNGLEFRTLGVRDDSGYQPLL